MKIRIFLILSIMICCILPTFAENQGDIKFTAPEIIPLWKDKAPTADNGLPTDAEKVENINWISSVTQPELFIFPAQNPNGKALIMCPGGGYAGVAMTFEGLGLAPLLNENGITLAVLKYRMPNGNHKVPAEDVHEAMRILTENSAKWGINPKKIGIGGASAGGHLASTVATHPVEDAPTPAFQVLLYPVISMEEGITHQGSRNLLLGENPSNELVELYSNDLQVSPTTPPAFIVVSGDDKTVPVENSLLYYKALNSNKIPATLHIYPDGGHGWGTRLNFKHNQQWTNELVSWLLAL